MSTAPWQEVGDRVYRRWYDSLSLNIGLIVGDGEALVVDTRATYGQADELKTEITRVTSAPVRYVVNTHHHWDHTFGNARFGGSELVGHTRCASRLVATGPEMKRHLEQLVAPEDRDEVQAIEIVPPTTTFDDTLELDVGGRLVTLSYLGRAHTDNDIVIRAAGVVFAGDLLEESAPPYFGDSFPLEWPDTLTAMLDGDLYVPGHGDVMSPAEASDQLADLEAVRREVEECLRSGWPISEGPYPLEVMHTALERGRVTLGDSSGAM